MQPAFPVDKSSRENKNSSYTIAPAATHKRKRSQTTTLQRLDPKIKKAVREMVVFGQRKSECNAGEANKRYRAFQSF